MVGFYLAEPDTSGLPTRAAAKAERRVDLLRAAAQIMADKGFHAMRLEDLGEAVGISGPAVYRHFSSKEEILTELMTGISQKLYAEADRITEELSDPKQQVQALIDLQIDFAISEPELIRLHNRELFRMGEQGREDVRKAQGGVLKIMATALANYDQHYQGEVGRVTAQLIFGMINSLELTRSWASLETAREVVSNAVRSAVGLHTK